MIRRPAIWMLAGLVALSGCADVPPVESSFVAVPSVLTKTAGLQSSRYGEIEFIARDGNRLRAFTYRASAFNPRVSPVLFVIHGASRNADRYIRTAAPVAERNSALAVAIEFPKDLYPASRGFTLGVTTSGPPDASALREQRWRVPQNYLHAEVEHLFSAILQELGGEQPGYYLFGHSAGAQFVHRLMTFVPEPRVLGAVAANAGWYTLPVAGSGASYSMPYGLSETPVTEANLRNYLEAPLTVLVGENDTASPGQDKLVRGTLEAMLQGKSRYERGAYFYQMGLAQADQLAVDSGWRFDEVPHARHSAAQMMPAAGFYLFDSSATDCQSSSSGQATITITEILADPPDGLAGDANGDGIRDPSDDEFVELVNTGTQSVCLSGWTLGDASDLNRHVFPPGSQLRPGQALVVFGGGVPTGDFAGAVVQWATHGGRLNLNNSGDVLTLRDHEESVEAQLSWGDCDGQTCAAEHLALAFDQGASVFRDHSPTGQWRHHADVAGARFSPAITAMNLEQGIAGSLP